ncbi:uncharacterized protein BDR25DRAFT_101026 [Lindgomyces ingoldianus]|uniref:Uncharacterized protein n=1 Tax=Lindgomyces ingoldianus TaxID=673940 RepID=A0ACB6R9M6_9PLEO|nr:uncharacterized protein BDR25DRAFT_101026 [Lindgomyces ingoldianus]KAF2475227.1 hypothetical protein BDR25DRAFT_101026 [Lindgomyces ingoldianus]
MFLSRHNEKAGAYSNQLIRPKGYKIMMPKAPSATNTATGHQPLLLKSTSVLCRLSITIMDLCGCLAILCLYNLSTREIYSDLTISLGTRSRHQPIRPSGVKHATTPRNGSRADSNMFSIEAKRVKSCSALPLLLLSTFKDPPVAVRPRYGCLVR